MFIEKSLRLVNFVVFDFDGVFTDNSVIVGSDGSESVKCWRGDGLGLRSLEEVGIKAAILSTEKNPIVGIRANKLGIFCKQGVRDKGEALVELCDFFKVSLSATAYLGNDINDIPAFKIVGLPVGVSDGHPDIDPYIKIKTFARGGFGAVREFCDLVTSARQAT